MENEHFIEPKKGKVKDLISKFEKNKLKNDIIEQEIQDDIERKYSHKQHIDRPLPDIPHSSNKKRG